MLIEFLFEDICCGGKNTHVAKLSDAGLMLSEGKLWMYNRNCMSVAFCFTLTMREGCQDSMLPLCNNQIDNARNNINSIA